MRIPEKLFRFFVPPSIWATRNSGRARSARWLMRSLAGITMLLTRARRQTDIEAVAREWQRMFPPALNIPIVGMDEKTAYVELRVKCPYRGTGNLDGCYRLMEYDRALLERIGGQLVVLVSQAGRGLEVCRVAIRKTGAVTDDLVPAHIRGNAPQSELESTSEGRLTHNPKTGAGAS